MHGQEIAIADGVVGRPSGFEEDDVPISQREARLWKRRAQQAERVLEDQRRTWSQQWFGGVDIARHACPDTVAMAVRTARKLNHAVVAVADEEGTTVRFLALPHPQVKP